MPDELLKDKSWEESWKESWKRLQCEKEAMFDKLEGELAAAEQAAAVKVAAVKEAARLAAVKAEAEQVATVKEAARLAAASISAMQLAADKKAAEANETIAALVRKVSAMELAAEEATQQKTYVEKRLAVANATIALRSIESNGVEDSIRWAAGARLAGAHNDLRKHVTEAHNQSCRAAYVRSRAAARSTSAPPTMRT